MSIHRRQAKSGVRWDVRLRRPDGSAYSRTFRTKAEAERFQTTELADRMRGAWLDPAAGQMLVSAWADEWYLSSVNAWRPRTADAHRLALDRHWIPRIGQLRMVEVTPRLVQGVVNEMGRQYKPSSIRTYYATVRSLMADAVAAEVLGRSPCRGVKLPALERSERRVVTPTELHHLAEAVGERWRPLIYLGGVMGLRFGEAIALRPADLDFETPALSVERTVVELDGRLILGQPKTAASVRKLAMPGPLAEELLAHVSRQAIPVGDLLFSDRNGRPIRRSNFSRRVFRPAAMAVGLDDLSFHGLRHSAATHWVAAGVDLRAVQHRLGHADPRLVLRLYAHVSSDADRLAAERSAQTYWGSSDQTNTVPFASGD